MNKQPKNVAVIFPVGVPSMLSKKFVTFFIFFFAVGGTLMSIPPTKHKLLMLARFY